MLRKTSVFFGVYAGGSVKWATYQFVEWVAISMGEKEGWSGVGKQLQVVFTETTPLIWQEERKTEDKRVVNRHMCRDGWGCVNYYIIFVSILLLLFTHSSEEAGVMASADRTR